MGIEETGKSTQVAQPTIESYDIVAEILLSILLTSGEKSSTLGFVVPIGRPR